MVEYKKIEIRTDHEDHNYKLFLKSLCSKAHKGIIKRNIGISTEIADDCNFSLNFYDHNSKLQFGTNRFGDDTFDIIFRITDKFVVYS